MNKKIKFLLTMITIMIFVGIGCKNIYASDQVLKENSGISIGITETEQEYYFTPSKSGEYYLFSSGYANVYTRVYKKGDYQDELDYESGEYPIGNNEYKKIRMKANEKYEIIVGAYDEEVCDGYELYCGDYDFAKNIPIKGEFSHSNYCNVGDDIILTPHITNIFDEELSNEKMNFEYKWYKVNVSEDDEGNEIESRGENISNEYKLNFPNIKQSQLSDETYSYYLCEVYLNNKTWDDRKVYLYNKDLHYSVDAESFYSEPGASVSIVPIIRNYKGDVVENPEKIFTFKWSIEESTDDDNINQQEITDKYKLETIVQKEILYKGYWNRSGKELKFSVYKDGKRITSAVMRIYDKNYVYKICMFSYSNAVYEGDDIVIQPILSNYKNQEIKNAKKEELKFVWYKCEYIHTKDYEEKNIYREKIGTDSMLVLKNISKKWYGCEYDLNYDHKDVSICCEIYKNGILVQSVDDIRLNNKEPIDNYKVPTGRIVYVKKDNKVNLNAEIYSARGGKIAGNTKGYTYEWKKKQGNSGYVYNRNSCSFSISKVKDSDIYTNKSCTYICTVYKDDKVIGEETFYLFYSKEKSKKDDNNINEIKKPKVKIRKVKNVKSKKVKIRFAKVTKAKGYQIQYALDRKFRKYRKTKNTSKTSYTIKKLKKKKTYYIRVRAYVSNKGKKVYSKWSKTVKVKIEK